LKYILKGIFKILNKGEKIKLTKLIIFDLVIGFLDIAFLGGLLLIINFYTKKITPPKFPFFHGALSDPNSLLLIGTFLMLFGIKNWVAYTGIKSQHHFFYAIASRLSKRNMMSFLKGDYGSFVNINSAVHIRKIGQQPVEFSHYILTNFQQLISQVILIFFTVCAILLYHPSIFVLLFLILLPPVSLLGWFIRKKLKAIRVSTKIASEKTIQHLQEALTGYVESNIYHKNNFFSDRYSGYQQQLNENIASQQSLQSLPSRLIEVFAVLGFFILVAINKWSATSPPVDLLTIGVFMVAACKIIPGIVKILNCTGQMKTYQFTIQDLLLDEQKPTEPQNIRVAESISSLSFKRVYFDYNDRAILKNANFDLSPGDFAGITGTSGKGKTTLINLLLGYLSPVCGTICINNKITDAAERQPFWNRISYLKQQPFLIEDSILKNITLSDGAPNATKLNSVITFCGMDAMLAEFPEGIEKVTRENGKNISGGQRQRIMLARALYHDFDLLILDEPFGELDSESEQCILKKLQLLAGQEKMILFITHNKASLSYCNKIISLHEA
jgi:ABC-type bacteriocin/lantibiotic exporter with double-glycine peptidase domain